MSRILMKGNEAFAEAAIGYPRRRQMLFWLSDHTAE